MADSRLAPGRRRAVALAIGFDAVPSLIAMLGRCNWWAPAPLRRLHERIGLREA